MCLFLPKRIKSEKDIICYKVLNTRLQSVVYEFQYQIGETYSLDSKIKIEKIEKTSLMPEFSYSCPELINKGFHSYVKYQTPHPFCKVVKCLIPKDAEVYKGVDGCLKECYVSNKIKILEEI